MTQHKLVVNFYFILHLKAAHHVILLNALAYYAMNINNVYRCALSFTVCVHIIGKECTASSTHSTTLEEVTFGALAVKVGMPPSLQKDHPDFFVHNMDKAYCDDTTSKAVYSNQKPIDLCGELVDLYTTPEDWIVSLPTGIGMFSLYENAIVL